jgi:hypothetical protein
VRRWLLLIAVGVFFGVSVNSGADQGAIYHLSFRTFHALPGERLSKFDLHIHSAMVIRFRTIPVGWQINIDNDPSWMTQVSGTAVVGAADLEPSALQPWFLSLLAEPGSRSEPRDVIKVEGSVTLSNGENTRVVQIVDHDVALIPSPRAQRSAISETLGIARSTRETVPSGDTK